VAEKYKRFTGGYRYNESQDETSGTEVYIRHDDAAGGIDLASLPILGTTPMLDPAGGTIATCIVRRKDVRYIDNDPATPEYTFGYSTQKGASPGRGVNTDPATRRFDLGGEVVSIPEGNLAWYWTTDHKSISQAIYKKIITGSFTIPKGPLTTAQKTTFIGLVKSQAGTICDAAFEDFSEGQVLFEGLSGGTTYLEGELRWQFDMSFAFRLINDALTAITQDDWLYIWREDQAIWDKPTDSPGVANFLYSKSTFSSLI